MQRKNQKGSSRRLNKQGQGKTGRYQAYRRVNGVQQQTQT
jgi:ribosomal protein L35